jgi:hypothetical protein
MDGATAPDSGADLRGIDDVVGQTHRAGERHRLGTAVQQRLGTVVDGHAGYVGHPQVPADLSRFLQHGDAYTRLAEEVRRGEAADTPADHHNVARHGF